MQTFLPYANFSKSAACLDRARLGKQRVEVLQLLKALLVPGAGWANHPAALMWKGHEGWLCWYGEVICKEWIKRGYKDTCLDKIRKYKKTCSRESMVEPYWVGNEDFHRSHQSNLLRKDYVYYSKFFPGVPADLPYIWPTT